MTNAIAIRLATSSETENLSAIAYRSKAYWGYSHEFLEACRDELMVSVEEIENPRNCYYVGELINDIVGFYGLSQLTGDTIELSALFLEPYAIGKGFGKALFEHAKFISLEAGAHFLLIQSDPNASEFYTSMGCEQIGERESGSIPGRFLPEYRVAQQK